VRVSGRGHDVGERAQARRGASGACAGRRAPAGELGGGGECGHDRRPRAHLRRGGSLPPSEAPLVVRSLDGEFWSLNRRRTHDAPAPSPCAAAWPAGSTSSHGLLRIQRREPPPALSPLPPCTLHLLLPPSCWR
jgi:hypothetical protein